MTQIIKTNRLSKVFSNGDENVIAVKNVSININEKQIVSIVGSSGSGKSTFLSMLGGLTSPSTGELIIDGINIYKLKTSKLALLRREYIGFVFQSFNLMPHLTIEENVKLPSINTGISMEEQREKAKYYLEKVSLYDKKSRLASELSGGEQQRAAIARALINNPPIILADEPTGNLDSSNGKAILALFEKVRESGKTIIIVTHDELLSNSTDRKIRFKDGEVLEDDSMNLVESFENEGTYA